MSDETALIVVEKLNPVEIFQNGGMDKILKEIESKVDGLVFDISTEEGRKECISTAYRVTRSKCVLDNLGKEYGSDLKKKLDAINADRRKAKNFLEPLAAKVREPVTEWELEQERIKKEEEERERKKIQAQVENLQKYGKVMSMIDVAILSDDKYAGILEQAKADHKAEQDRLAAEAREREAEAKRLAEERAELEKLRAEQAERDRIDRERIEVAERYLAEERKAIEEAQAAERRKLQAERDAIQAEKTRIAHEEAVKKAADEARIKAEQEAKDRAERIARENLERAAREIREAKEREESEAAEKARIEAARPDREKLMGFAQYLSEGITLPVLTSVEAQGILIHAVSGLSAVSDRIIEEVESAWPER